MSVESDQWSRYVSCPHLVVQQGVEHGGGVAGGRGVALAHHEGLQQHGHWQLTRVCVGPELGTHLYTRVSRRPRLCNCHKREENAQLAVQKAYIFSSKNKQVLHDIICSSQWA